MVGATVDGSRAVIRSSDLREFATTMYLLVVLRFLLGLLPSVAALQWDKVLAGSASGRTCPKRSGARAALPHEWTSMDYVLTESPPGLVYCVAGTFEKANHPLHSVFRLARRLAGISEPYPALAAAVCLAGRQSSRYR